MPFSLLIPTCPALPGAPGALALTLPPGLTLNPGNELLIPWDDNPVDDAAWWQPNNPTIAHCQFTSLYHLQLDLTFTVAPGPPFGIVGSSFVRNQGNAFASAAISTAFQTPSHTLDLSLEAASAFIQAGDDIAVRISNSSPAPISITSPGPLFTITPI
jgi:hypothetical protein